MATTAREKQRAQNNLICLLQGLVGEKVTVELRREDRVTGFLKSVDGYMDINMSDVKLLDVNGIETYFESFYVKGKHIRYVQVPDELDMLMLIKTELGIRERTKTRIERKPGRKFPTKEERKKRMKAMLLQKQQETMKLLEELVDKQTL